VGKKMDDFDKVMRSRTLSRQKKIAKVVALLRSDAVGQEYRRAVLYLKKCGPDAISAVPVLAKMLAKRPYFLYSYYHYRYITEALIKIGPPGIDEAISYSIRALSSRFVYARERACEVLLEIAGDSKAREHYHRRRQEIGKALLKVLNDSSFMVRSSAPHAYALLGYRSSECVPIFVDALRTRIVKLKDSLGVRSLLSVLSQFDAKDVVPALVPFLEIETAWVRSNIAECLAAFGAGSRPALEALRRSAPNPADDIYDIFRKNIERSIRRIEKS
jgi:HEAT repeat protein